MPIGVISSPSTWLLGAVITPLWCQQVQDNTNAFITGTGSLTSLTLDGVGGRAVSPTAAQLVIGQSALANTALQVWQDQAGNVRQIVDHLGYRRGRVTEFYEDWMTFNTSLTGTTTLGRWSATLPTGASIVPQDAGGIFPTACSVQHLLAGVTTGQNAIFKTIRGIVSPQSYLSLVLEWEMELSVAGANSADWIIGLHSGTTGTPSGAASSVAVCKQSSDTNWQLLTANGGSFTKTSLGVAPVTVGNPQRFTLELHGSSSPYGALARCSVNEGAFVETALTLPTVAMNFQVTASTVGTASHALQIGPVHGLYNRQLSIPTV